MYRDEEEDEGDLDQVEDWTVQQMNEEFISQKLTRKVEQQLQVGPRTRSWFVHIRCQSSLYKWQFLTNETYENKFENETYGNNSLR